MQDIENPNGRTRKRKRFKLMHLDLGSSLVTQFLEMHLFELEQLRVAVTCDVS